MALRLHPDKVLSSTSPSNSASYSTDSTPSLTPTQLFQRLSFSYSILSDQAKRSRYDSTGRTSEPAFGSEHFDWNDYFKTLWTGEVSGNTLKQFKQDYQSEFRQTNRKGKRKGAYIHWKTQWGEETGLDGFWSQPTQISTKPPPFFLSLSLLSDSSEERADITEAYLKNSGSLSAILSSIPCAEVLQDEERIIGIVGDLIEKGDLKKSKGWTDSLKDEKGREKMRGKARKEATEAEEMAREMGVWEELFGDGSKSKSEREKKGKKMGKEEAEIGSDDGHEDDEEEEDDDDDQIDEEDEEEEGSRPRKKTKTSTSNGKASSSTSKTKSKSKVTSSSSSSSTSKTKSKTANDKSKKSTSTSSSAANQAVEEDPSLSGLASLIASRQKKRAGEMDGLIERLEREAKEKESGSQAKGKGKRKGTR